MKMDTKTLNDNNVFQSKSRRENCLDHFTLESFFGMMKQEIYDGGIYESFEALEHAVNEFIY